MPIGKAQLGRGEPAQPVGRGDLDRFQVAGRRTRRGACVHRHHPAHRAGNSRSPRDAHAPLLACERDESGDGRAGSEREQRVVAALFHLLGGEVRSELENRAFHSDVADHGVRAAAEREPRHSGVAEDAEHRHQRLGIARPDPELRRSADADAGPRREGDILQHLAARGALERGDQHGHARRRGRA